jgi:hypothetical protein
MSNVFDDVRAAISSADDAQRAVDMEARKMNTLDLATLERPV